MCYLLCVILLALLRLLKAEYVPVVGNDNTGNVAVATTKLEIKRNGLYLWTEGDRFVGAEYTADSDHGFTLVIDSGYHFAGSRCYCLAQQTQRRRVALPR